MHLIIAFTATELHGTPQAHFSFAVLGGTYIIAKHIILCWHNTKLFSCMASTTLRKKNLLWWLAVLLVEEAPRFSVNVACQLQLKFGFDFLIVRSN